MSKSDHLKKELEYINSDRIKKACMEMIELLPDYFFEIPASSTGKYHPDYALGKGGLLRHTKAAVRIAYELLGDECIGNKYTSNEKDLMIMALVLHDGLKSGYDYEKCRREHYFICNSSNRFAGGRISGDLYTRQGRYHNCGGYHPHCFVS